MNSGSATSNAGVRPSNVLQSDGSEFRNRACVFIHPFEKFGRSGSGGSA